jgi:hypothetical protein
MIFPIEVIEKCSLMKLRFDGFVEKVYECKYTKVRRNYSNNWLSFKPGNKN